MSGRRTMWVGLGLLVAAGGCDRFDSSSREPAPSPEPAVAVPAVDDLSPPPVSPEPLALRFVSPNLGPPAGGNEVTIDGRGFAAYPHVAFGSVHAWIRSVTPTEIRVTVPAPARPLVTGETRTVDVRVSNPPEGSEDPVSQTLVRAYSYVAEGEAPAGEAPAGEAADAYQAPPPAEAGETPAPPSAPPGPALVAHFTFETVADAEDCPPPSTAVRFTDRSTGGASAWLWDFGDGTSSGEQHPEHCYTAPGMRSVSLTVSGGGSSASASTIVTTGME